MLRETLSSGAHFQPPSQIRCMSSEIARLGPAGYSRQCPVAEDKRTSDRGQWCCRKGLNFRPLPYQGSALPLSYGSIVAALSFRLENVPERGDPCHKVANGATFRHERATEIAAEEAPGAPAVSRIAGKSQAPQGADKRAQRQRCDRRISRGSGDRNPRFRRIQQGQLGRLRHGFRRRLPDMI
jgi:hypothetical protein